METIAVKNTISGKVIHVARTNGIQHKTLCGRGSGGRFPTAHFVPAEINCLKCLKILENLENGTHEGGLNGPGHRDKVTFVDLGDGNYQTRAHIYGDT